MALAILTCTDCANRQTSSTYATFPHKGLSVPEKWRQWLDGLKLYILLTTLSVSEMVLESRRPRPVHSDQQK